MIKIISIVTIFTILLLLPAGVSAARYSCPTDPDPKKQNVEVTACDTEECGKCVVCGNTWSGIGCVGTNSVSAIVISLTRIALGVVGGVMLLLTIYTGYLYQTGETENIEKAKKKITQIFYALVFLVFSALLLRVIGLNILNVVNPAVIG